MGKLTVAKARAAGPGRHGDGKGLYLFVKPSGARSWVLRVQHNGRRQDIGLGSDADLTLNEARDRAAELRKFARQGKDARAERDREKRVIPTFADAAKRAHEELGKGWAAKTAIAFKASLDAHAVPKLGRLRVDEIASEHVIAALAPIWTEKPEQARKIRHRIVQVLAFSKSRGWRTAPLPETRELRQGLAKQRSGGHFAAMPYADVPAFVAGELAKGETPARLSLLFAIFTAARSGEVRNASWQQIDLEARTWNRPGEIMKAGIAHSVTLNKAALAILDRAGKMFGRNGLVFPSAKPGKPMSDMSLSKMMRAAGSEFTVHGFRSSFRDWAAEKMPTVPAMVAEMVLAHAVGTKTEQSYLRSDLAALRFKLMNAWGDFAAPSPAFGRHKADKAKGVL